MKRPSRIAPKVSFMNRLTSSNEAYDEETKNYAYNEHDSKRCVDQGFTQYECFH